MLSIDLIGLLITICLTGLRYPHQALAAALVHDLGLVLVAIFLDGRVDAVQAAGAFGSAAVSGLAPGLPAVAVALGGALANFAVGINSGGVGWEDAGSILNPGASLNRPFPVINIRLGILSAAVTLWKLAAN